MPDSFETEPARSPLRAELRQQLRQARRALTPHQQQQAAIGICQQLLAVEPFQQAACIATYLANDGEPDLAPVLEFCWQQQITTTVPVLHPFTRKHLLFLRYNPTTPMRVNRFNIAEPVLDCQQIQPLSRHHVILMPLVGFDKLGNRLGMGGGFYDRTLAVTAMQPDARPLFIGVAHDCQQVALLPMANWDIPCDLIVTPTRLIKPAPPASRAG